MLRQLGLVVARRGHSAVVLWWRVSSLLPEAEAGLEEVTGEIVEAVDKTGVQMFLIDARRLGEGVGEFATGVVEQMFDFGLGPRPRLHELYNE